MSNQICNCYNGSGRFYNDDGGYNNYTQRGGYGYNKHNYGRKKSYKPAFSTKPSYQSYVEPEAEHEYSYEPAEDTSYFAYNTTKKSSSRYIGVRVYHETFGYGTVVAVSGSTCEVEFDGFGRKKVMGSYFCIGSGHQ
jgi:hypothetical protein